MAPTIKWTYPNDGLYYTILIGEVPGLSNVSFEIYESSKFTSSVKPDHAKLLIFRGCLLIGSMETKTVEEAKRHAKILLPSLLSEYRSEEESKDD